MADQVLVPFDGSSAAYRAVEYARSRFPEVTLTLLYVVDPMADYSRHRAYPGYTATDEFSSEREKGKHLLESIRDELPEETIVETEIIVGSPGSAIIEYADEHDVNQIVIGSHGKEGLARYLLGSVAETVVRRARVPVTVVRPDK